MGNKRFCNSRVALTNPISASPATTPMLPPELWNRIFADLPPKDFLSVINTCPEWRLLLNSKVTKSLLPLVLEQLSDYLSLDAFLNCRFLNRDTKAKVDSILQKEESPLTPAKSFQTEQNENKSQNSNNMKIKALNEGSYKFDSVEKIRRFMDHFKSQEPVGANPFLTRSAFVPIGKLPNTYFAGLPAGDRVIQWESTVAGLLSRFGTYLSTLIIFLHDFSAEHHGQSIINLLGLVPNLKVLRFCGEGDSWKLEQVHGWKNLGFPLLPNLKVIDMADCATDLDEEQRHSSLLEPFILKYGDQFKRIIVGAVDETGEDDMVNEIHVFKQNLLLAENHGQIILGETYGYYGTDVVAISGMGNKLKELQLMYIKHVESFRQSLNYSAPHLRRLNLFCYLPIPRVGKLNINIEKLPKLTQLSTWIDNMEIAWFMGFLKEKCEYLRIVQLYVMEKTSKEEVKDEALRTACSSFHYLPQMEIMVVWSDDGVFEFSREEDDFVWTEISKGSKRYMELQLL